MDLANLIISVVSLAVLIGMGLAAVGWSRKRPTPMPLLPDWPESDEAGEKLADWRKEDTA